MYAETRFSPRGEIKNYDRPGSQMVFGCDKCGASVTEEDMASHAKWHRQMAGIAGLMYSDKGVSFTFIAKEYFIDYIQQVNGWKLRSSVVKEGG